MTDLKDVGGQAVATIQVPEHTAQVIVASSSIAGCAVAAVKAWNKVKAKDDADFASAEGGFRQHLLNHAESVYRTGKVLDGNTSLARFEQEVAKIKDAQDRAAK